MSCWPISLRPDNLLKGDQIYLFTCNRDHWIPSWTILQHLLMWNLRLSWMKILVLELLHSTSHRHLHNFKTRSIDLFYQAQDGWQHVWVLRGKISFSLSFMLRQNLPISIFVANLGKIFFWHYSIKIIGNFLICFLLLNWFFSIKFYQIVF